MEPLNSSYGRISHMTVDAPSIPVWMSLWAHLCNADWVNLERLSVTTTPPSVPTAASLAHRAPPAGFAVMPALKEMRLSGHPSFWATPALYGSLIALRLCRVGGKCCLDWGAFEQVLRWIPRLRLLQVAGVEWFNVADISPLVLGHLTDLHITYRHRSTLLPLRRLHMDSLTLLHVHVLSDTLYGFTDDFRDILARVHAVKLRLDWMSFDDLHWFLSNVPCIRELDITGCPDVTLENIKNMCSWGILKLPNLVDLTVAGYVAEALIPPTGAVAPGFTVYQKGTGAAGRDYAWRYGEGGIAEGAQCSFAYRGASIADQWAKYEYQRLELLV
ncbi:hypothetical protein MSAN_00762300 [Mycena sanguinolenta]|uniref:F-box protein n=1 Tax=Mycena sanguinolenta TaxID=230812 RepID=A0A8H6Z281_9AGAR|nr:hypothetical protein MSAN_00762300 [Mycena sanguinolenta]